MMRMSVLCIVLLTLAALPNDVVAARLEDDFANEGDKVSSDNTIIDRGEKVMALLIGERNEEGDGEEEAAASEVPPAGSVAATVPISMHPTASSLADVDAVVLPVAGAAASGSAAHSASSHAGTAPVTPAAVTNAAAAVADAAKLQETEAALAAAAAAANPEAIPGATLPSTATIPETPPNTVIPAVAALGKAGVPFQTTQMMGTPAPAGPNVAATNPAPAAVLSNTASAAAVTESGAAKPNPQVSAIVTPTTAKPKASPKKADEENGMFSFPMVLLLIVPIIVVVTVLAYAYYDWFLPPSSSDFASPSSRSTAQTASFSASVMQAERDAQQASGQIDCKQWANDARRSSDVVALYSVSNRAAGAPARKHCLSEDDYLTSISATNGSFVADDAEHPRSFSADPPNW